MRTKNQGGLVGCLANPRMCADPQDERSSGEEDNIVNQARWWSASVVAQFAEHNERRSRRERIGPTIDSVPPDTTLGF